MNQSSTADLYLVRRQGKRRAEVRAEPRKPELRVHCDPGGWYLHRRCYDLPRPDQRLHAAGTATGMPRAPGDAEGRGREEPGDTGPGSSGGRAPGLKLLMTSPSPRSLPSSPPRSLVEALKPISGKEKALPSPPNALRANTRGIIMPEWSARYDRSHPVQLPRNDRPGPPGREQVGRNTIPPAAPRINLRFEYAKVH